MQFGKADDISQIQCNDRQAPEKRQSKLRYKTANTTTQHGFISKLYTSKVHSHATVHAGTYQQVTMHCRSCEESSILMASRKAAHLTQLRNPGTSWIKKPAQSMKESTITVAEVCAWSKFLVVTPIRSPKLWALRIPRIMVRQCPTKISTYT